MTPYALNWINSPYSSFRFLEERRSSSADLARVFSSVNLTGQIILIGVELLEQLSSYLFNNVTRVTQFSSGLSFLIITAPVACKASLTLQTSDGNICIVA
jgi:hypothetical protein